MATQIPDGSLLDWRDIEGQHEWSVLFLGNGLSINVWPRFAYGALFDHVRGGGLTPTDLALFSDTPNFERVLGDLNTAIRVADVFSVRPQEFYDAYRRIQLALGHAIREVHPNRWDVANDALLAIRQEMVRYEWIFTTSYDLIAYWAMGRGPYGAFRPYMDLFRGNRCEFDPARAQVEAGWVPVYFLHGALHLVVSGTGRTWKLRRTMVQTLLDQFGQPISGDPQARPLFVTEGSARDKLQAIEANDYLSHALGRLRTSRGQWWCSEAASRPRTRIW
jgi:hypothetical protein